MYCQACGAQLTKGLAYCNRCGARTSTAALQTPGPPPDKLAEVMHALAVMSALVTLGGFVFIYALVGRLLGLGFEQSRVLTLVFFCLLAVGGIAALLIRQFSRALTTFLRTNQADAPQPPAELPARDTAQIEAPREPAASVTDHTTRTFDPVYAERNEK